MQKKLWMGNEAIAMGALRAGVSVVTGYPGTPSTEILETIAKCGDSRVYVEWSVNEKSAMEVAAGASLSGARALVTMKQVGLNVASDPLMSLNYVGVLGGLVVVVADDPGPISSQTEQDTRRFGQFAKLAVFDPSTPEEAYEMVTQAIAVSEKYGRPVLLRPTTRVCHSYATVASFEDWPRRPARGFSKDGGRWAIFPRLSYENHLKIEAEQVQMAQEFSRSRYNVLSGRGRKGVAAGGVSWQYAMEALDGRGTPVKLLKISLHPFPNELAARFLDGLDEVLVLEELDPVIEDALVRLCGREQRSVRICGKRSGHTPCAGELTVDFVRGAIESFLGVPARGSGGGKDKSSVGASVGTPAASWTKAPMGASAESRPEPRAQASAGAPVGTPVEPRAQGPAGTSAPSLPVRPPVLCAGCPHRGSFFAVKEALKGRRAVFTGDIGCYTLGNAKPLDMVDTCLCMGAGITMAQGLWHVEPDTVHVAFIGDSTFFHTGMPGLLNAVYNETDILVAILDNATTAMTGNQPHPGMGKTATGKPAPKADIRRIAEAMGVTAVVRVNAFDTAACKQAVLDMLSQTGVRVIVFEGPCIALAKRKTPLAVNADVCTGCGACVRKLGCPALSMAGRKAVVDTVLCTGCGVCAPVCPVSAIQPKTGGEGLC